MAHQNSDLLSKLGIVFTIFKSLNDAAIRAHVENNEALLRQLEDDKVANKVITHLIQCAGLIKRKPIINGFSDVNYIEVDYDDPRWQRIYKKRYAFCNQTSRTGDFPLRHTGGKFKIGYTWIPSNYFDHNPSNEEIMREIKYRNCSRPDRAISETVLDTIENELIKNSSAAICGIVQINTNDHPVVGCVDMDENGRSLNLYRLCSRWNRFDQFLVVVSEERMAAEY